MAALLGALGGAVADGLKIAEAMLASKAVLWTKPEQRMPLAVALAIRIGCAASLSGVVAAQSVAGWSDQPLALFLIGLAAPTVVQHGSRLGRACLKAIMGEYFGGGGGGGGI